MPARDPETGQYVSGGSMAGTTYSDHDVHWVRHQVNFLNAADSGPNTEYEDVRQYEITERGLDPDELAELRAMTVSGALLVTIDNTDQDLSGSVAAEVGCGYNLTGEEFIRAFGQLDTETADVDSSGTDDFRAGFRDTDEVGQLFSHSFGCGISFSEDTTTGAGGGGAAGYPSFSRTLSFPGLTGTGPVVDAADDFSSRVSLDVNNMVTGVKCDVVYGLYYSVEEAEGGRTRFGR